MLTGQEKNLIILLLGNEQIIGVETMDQELRKAQEHHVGRIIHMLSHQLKRRGTMPEVEMGLTPMQKHVLTFILFEDDGAGSVPAGYRRGVPHQKIYRKRDFAADGKKTDLFTAKVLRGMQGSNRLSLRKRQRNSGWIFW